MDIKSFVEKARKSQASKLRGERELAWSEEMRKKRGLFEVRFVTFVNSEPFCTANTRAGTMRSAYYDNYIDAKKRHDEVLGYDHTKKCTPIEDMTAEDYGKPTPATTDRCYILSHEDDGSVAIACGCAIVYEVDSIPKLWTEHDWLNACNYAVPELAR